MQIAGLVWYRPQHYQRALALMEDAHLMPKTYASWLEQAQRSEQHFARLGITTAKAYIDPDAFGQWCTERGLRIDAQGRKAFANAVARAHASDRH